MKSRLVLLALAVATAQTPAQKPVTVIFETELGNITMEIDVVHAPITGQNFLKYVDGKFYDGGRFHRTVTPGNQPQNKVKIEVSQGGINPAKEKEEDPTR